MTDHHLDTVMSPWKSRIGNPPGCRLSRLDNNRGALLISLILTLTVMAVLGAAMVYMTASSSHGFLTAASQQKAYYLAYSGLTYYDAQAVKPDLPQTYRLANGDRFVLDVEGLPERLTSTGIVAGPFGETRYRLVARGSGGTPDWIDTMENTDNWRPDALSPGNLETAVLDGNSAMRTVGNPSPCRGPAARFRFKAPSRMPLPSAMIMKAGATAPIPSRWNGSGTISMCATGLRWWALWRMRAPS